MTAGGCSTVGLPHGGSRDPPPSNVASCFTFVQVEDSLGTADNHGNQVLLGNGYIYSITQYSLLEAGSLNSYIMAHLD